MTSISIDAKPTKEFFITMLTRDIPLNRAILDLIDNSVDAANSIMLSEGLNDLSNFEINIVITKDMFQISDNCGGFDLETGQKYAFRFGRDPKAPPTPNSVGQFGVGMKRTLFKLGEKFKVITKSKNDNGFTVDVDVNEWKSADEWNFPCQVGDTGLQDGTTTILVESLYREVAEQFSLKDFINNLIYEVSLAHFMPIHYNLKIKINDVLVPKYDFQIFQNESINPQIKEICADDVSIRIIAGISERSPEKSGWYIVCNGRLIVTADKTRLTGWDSALGTRKFHNDFAHFRGIVIFESQTSSLLPWTTTKTGIDEDNKYYKIAFNQMLNVMNKILPVLNERAKEQKSLDNEEIIEAPLNRSISEARLVSLFKLDYRRKDFYTVPANLNTQAPSLVRIQYSVPISKFKMVSQLLKTDNQAEVGRRTFEYYFDYECGNE